MRKLKRLHVAVALITVASVVSLLGISLVGGTDGNLTMVKIKSTQPVEKCVWWFIHPTVHSGDYASWGRTMPHVTLLASGLAAGEQMDVYLKSHLPNPSKTGSVFVTAYHWTLTSNYYEETWTVYVPSKKFHFSAYGPSTSSISLSYYLSGS